MIRYVIAATAGLLAAGAAEAQTFDVFTSFEFEDTDGEFTVGESPITATFLNGEAKSIGAPALYQTGLNSWMVDAGQIGTIEFETPASLVDVWLRDQLPDVDSVMTFFSPGGDVLTTFEGDFVEWTHVVVDDVGPIGSITLQNNAGAGGYTVLDDFGFNAVPAPGAVALLGAGAIASSRRRRRSSARPVGLG